jgi:hypothetical protein
MSDTFDTMYSDEGRPSIPPELLLKSTNLMALYSVRSEHRCCEQLNYNILFRLFLGMDLREAGFERSVFSKDKQDKDDRNDGNGFKPSDPDVNFLSERRTNSTHSSMTEPEALHG